MMTKHEEIQKGVIFPAGKKNEAYAQVFTGQSYLNMLVNDPEVSVGVGNVTFEPGCRNHWHVHTDGYQILLVTGRRRLVSGRRKASKTINGWRCRRNAQRDQTLAWCDKRQLV